MQYTRCRGILQSRFESVDSVKCTLAIAGEYYKKEYKIAEEVKLDKYVRSNLLTSIESLVKEEVEKEVGWFLSEISSDSEMTYDNILECHIESLRNLNSDLILIRSVKNRIR